MADGAPHDPQPHVLRDYAFLADGERGVVLGPTGEVAWMCFPGWDGVPVFASLLGGRSRYVVRPAERFVWGGQYEAGTLVWRNRWVLVGGDIVECLEGLAFPGRSDRAVFVRRVIAYANPALVDVRLALGDDFGGHRRWPLHETDPGVWETRRGDLSVRWQVPARPSLEHGEAQLQLQVDPGAHADLVLELSHGPFDDEPADADDVLHATMTAWRRTVPDLQDTAAPRDARQAFAFLRGLTTSTGAMVAAATTSLPERADEARNYDYRYAWIRDQCYTGLAGAAAAGAESLMDDAVRFVHERLLSDGPNLRPAYRTNGEDVPDQRAVDLPGYPGASKVLIGNHANRQFQLDAFGEALSLFAAAASADRMHPEAWRAAEIAVAAIEQRWSEPDAGLWELAPKNYSHSRLVSAGALRQLAGVAPPGGRTNEWLQLADLITADTAAHALHPTGRWQRAPDDPRCDAALLLAGLRGAVPADDPRTVATLYAVRDELVVDGYTFRYRSDHEPLGQAEGAFLLCGYWLSLALHQAGDHREAARMFERNRAACGPAGIFSEEYDVHQRQLRGNLPQAFVHALLLETAATLGTDPRR